MQIDAIDALDFTAQTSKRAVYEAFEFRPQGGGKVEIENLSHGDDGEDHTYVVDVVSGLPSTCTCPADEYHDGACKHRVALALRPAVLDAAEAGQNQPVLADGGPALEEFATDANGEIIETPGYTTHREPPAQGGEEYVRCEGCGRELLIELGGREKLVHVDGCPNQEANR